MKVLAQCLHLLLLYSVPAPVVTITSDPVSPVQPVGVDVTLICTVELSPSVDIPVTVNTVWTGPDNLNRNIMAQQMGSTTTYTSTAMVSSFGRNQSGNYTCTANVISISVPFILTSDFRTVTSRITVGMSVCHVIPNMESGMTV